MTIKNVVNGDLIDAELAKLASQHTEPELRKWITTQAKTHLLQEAACFRRLSVTDLQKLWKANPWMIKAFPAGKPVWEFDPDDRDWESWQEDLGIAIGALAVRLATGKRNIQPVPFDQAFQEGVQSAAQSKIEEKLAEGPEDKELVFRFPNGWCWWKLLSDKAMRNESIHMNHCVGALGYFGKVLSGAEQILSLRDDRNIPHVTIQYVVDTKMIAQCKGNSNKGVKPEYKKAVIGLMKGMLRERKIEQVYAPDMDRSEIKIEEFGNFFVLDTEKNMWVLV